MFLFGFACEKFPGFVVLPVTVVVVVVVVFVVAFVFVDVVVVDVFVANFLLDLTIDFAIFFSGADEDDISDGRDEVRGAKVASSSGCQGNTRKQIPG